MLRGALRRPFAGLDPRTSTGPRTRSSPSLIRVEADEVTYNLHIVLRFELEQQIFDGTLALADLPEAWNTRMRDYFGIEVPSDADGVLQDVHWSSGAFGYFPTYSLGNVIAAQVWDLAARSCRTSTRSSRPASWSPCAASSATASTATAASSSRRR